MNQCPKCGVKTEDRVWFSNERMGSFSGRVKAITEGFVDHNTLVVCGRWNEEGRERTESFCCLCYMPEDWQKRVIGHQLELFGGDK